MVAMKTHTRPLDGRRILVVDDSPEMTELLADFFTEQGASVAQANSGWAAMTHLKAGPFDLIVLDLVMPDPDGWSILRFLQKTIPAAIRRVIVLTAGQYDSPAVSSLLDHRIACVFKPFLLDDLLSAACSTANLPKQDVAA
jgi:two-component system OmpR family response regulator